ncbi:tetratricopeptide repeat protein [Burkholderia sp. FERM BP-3421]|uniref:tetratricopeptide repeat protein n=1 Tax=Burkholderia sp. FERM BP-3421 TaxID=1494466 RepID=UPI00235FA601|nr:tetratricopeptide repeat protein [Burkholderia sp. FERM BP-3421]WDD94135.1 tetratricopeptide repeat protein [Burkholderia sp. FERM BP-3421]
MTHDQHRNIAFVKERYLCRQFSEALRAAQAALEVDPDDAELLNLASACHLALHNYADALTHLTRAIQEKPSFADAHNNLGVLHRAQARHDAAESSFRRALVAQPDHPDALLNLGSLLRSMRRLKEAESMIAQLITAAPDRPDALNLLGLILTDQGRLDHAKTAYRRALALQPDHAPYQLNLANALLAEGNWTEGLLLFEARHAPFFQGAHSSPPTVPFPQWRGEPIAGASLLIWPEQGHGDLIHLVRYIRRLKALGSARITLVCSYATLPLFAALPGADAVVPREAFHASACPMHDFWTYAWSIPYHLREQPSTIPAELPYLRAPANAASKWERFLPKGRLRVGLVWRGNPLNPSDSVRSLPGLKVLKPLWESGNVTFVSLQKDATAVELQAETDQRFIVNLGSRAANFADVAGMISRLDLVIGVDTAAMHLAAALGKPTWILISNVAADWRWAAQGSTSIWYPGAVTLFRQEVDETDWSGVVSRASQALSGMRTIR